MRIYKLVFSAANSQMQSFPRSRSPRRGTLALQNTYLTPIVKELFYSP
ncbi:MAG: hypothetical protein LBQ52_04275 [Helicobacteraceae bacterium]|nr:hypothetical protein [Helicobacteraceae bacterium]